MKVVVLVVFILYFLSVGEAGTHLAIYMPSGGATVTNLEIRVSGISSGPKYIYLCTNCTDPKYVGGLYVSNNLVSPTNPLSMGQTAYSPDLSCNTYDSVVSYMLINSCALIGSIKSIPATVTCSSYSLDLSIVTANLPALPACVIAPSLSVSSSRSRSRSSSISSSVSRTISQTPSSTPQSSSASTSRSPSLSSSASKSPLSQPSTISNSVIQSIMPSISPTPTICGVLPNGLNPNKTICDTERIIWVVNDSVVVQGELATNISIQINDDLIIEENGVIVLNSKANIVTKKCISINGTLVISLDKEMEGTHTLNDIIQWNCSLDVTSQTFSNILVVYNQESPCIETTNEEVYSSHSLSVVILGSKSTGNMCGNEEADGSSDVNLGAIIGGVLGGVAFVVLVVILVGVIIGVIHKKKRSKFFAKQLAI